MMYLFLAPIDVWLFRDGRPFTAGEDHRARSLFPPYPSVVQGAIRSHHLVVKGIDLRDQKAIERTVGTATDYRGLRMRGPFVARREHNGQITRFFPVPADATARDDDNKPRRRWAKPASKPAAAEGLLTSAPTSHLLGLEDEPAKADGEGWLDEARLLRYLRGEEVQVTPAHDLYQRESRLGIGLEDERRVAQERALYEVEFIRPTPGVGLYLEVAGYADWPPCGILRIGGEGHGARFEQVQKLDWPAIPDPLPECFKVCFVTPTYFREGWAPVNWERFFEGTVEMVAAAVGRYECLGGYDWAQQEHKPARRYVPAGSVYYFQCRGQARLKKDLLQQAITDEGVEIGFGQVLIVAW